MLNIFSHVVKFPNSIPSYANIGVMDICGGIY